MSSLYRVAKLVTLYVETDIAVRAICAGRFSDGSKARAHREHAANMEARAVLERACSLAEIQQARAQADTAIRQDRAEERRLAS